MTVVQHDLFLGGVLDGQTLAKQDHDVPTIIEPETLTVYIRQPDLDTSELRIWMLAEDEDRLRAVREIKQMPQPGKKALTLADLRTFVKTAEELDYPDDVTVRGLLTWAGIVKQLRINRDDC